MNSKFSKLKKGDKFRFENDSLHVVRMVVGKSWDRVAYINLTSPEEKPKFKVRWKKDIVHTFDEGTLLVMDTYKDVLKIQNETIRLHLQMTYVKLRNYIAYRTGVSEQEVQDSMEEMALVEREKMKPETEFSFL